MGHRRLRLAKAVAGVLLFLSIPRTSDADPVWHRVDTPNFVVIGTGSEKSLADTGLQFEGFREALSWLVSRTATATAVPTIVITFPSGRAFEPFRPIYNGKRVDVGGLFLSRQDVNYVLLGPGQSEESLRLIFHEYSHLIVNNVVPNLPPWLDEGLAEYYSSFELGKNGHQVLLGKPIASHYRTLANERWLSIPELIGTTHDSPQYNEGSRRSVFYAESWLLTHLLLHGQPDRRAKLAAYIDAVASNVPPADAWRQAFAGDDINNALHQYLARPLVSARQYTLSGQISRASGVHVALSPAAAEAIFGGLALAVGDKEEAAGRFKRALQLDPSSTRALIGASEAGGEAPSIKTLTSSDDWLADYLSAAAMVHGRVRDASLVSTAIPVLERAASEHPVANMFGLIAEAAGNEGTLSPADVDGLRGAYDSAPARDDYAFELARALVGQGHFASARSILGALIAHPHWPASRENALRMLRWAVEREQRATAASHAASTSPAVEASPTDAPGESVPADDHPASTTTPEREERVQPLYRDLKAGEQRAEGLLERVDCDTGKPAFVTVRYPDRVVRYRAAQLTDIQFITYRTTKAGTFSCGPRVPPDRVYLTWKRNAGGMNIVVAVEFLPAGR